MFVLLYLYIFYPDLSYIYFYYTSCIYIYIFLTTCTSIVHHACICMFFIPVCIYNIMNQFCDENNWMSGELLLPANTFTYLSERWDSTSWLDHCVSTIDSHDVIQNMFYTIRVHQTTFLCALKFPCS